MYDRNPLTFLDALERRSGSPRVAASAWLVFALASACATEHPPAPTSECAVHADCDDGDVCNGAESCVLGQCGSGARLADGVGCDFEGAEGVCREGECAESVCGDGIVALGSESCDDGNTISEDGCDADCTFSCEEDDACDDGNPCNGIETCGEARRCATGALPTGVVSCGEGLVCSGGACVESGCQNGVQEAPAEDCDDGNAVSGDGCEPNCRLTCWLDSDCDDGNACNGVETCDLGTNACVSGAAPDCEATLSASSACEEVACEPELGCVVRLNDHDHDGFAATELGACGTDCNDENDSIYPGAPELSDAIDNDCDGLADEDMPIWYADCDGDGFAPLGAEGVLGRNPPTHTPRQCSLGAIGTRWTTRAPEGADIDCNDVDRRMNPEGQAEQTPSAAVPVSLAFDFDCSGAIEPETFATGILTERSCWFDGTSCRGASGWATENAPEACGVEGVFTECVLAPGAMAPAVVCEREILPRHLRCR